MNLHKLRFLFGGSFDHYIYPTTVWTTVGELHDESCIVDMGSMTTSGSLGTDHRKQRNERILQQLHDSRRKESPFFSDDTNMLSPPFQTSQGQLGSTCDPQRQ